MTLDVTNHEQAQGCLHTRAPLARTRAAAERAADPHEDSGGVVRIAGKRLPQLRYPIGPGTKLVVMVKSLLPWRLYEAIVQRMLR